MARKSLLVALLITAICPLVFGIGVVFSSLMPSCQWAASAPAGGCFLLGMNLNWFITLATIAFVGSFFTVPIGILGVVASLIFMRREPKSSPASRR